jgi:hypothetical protein
MLPSFAPLPPVENLAGRGRVVGREADPVAAYPVKTRSPA